MSILAFGLPSSPRRIGGLALSLALVACGSGDKKADTASGSVSATRAPMAADTATSTAGGPMSGMTNMTGDADHDFLRQMSDHHKGLISLAHMTKERSDVGTAKADATKMDAAQDKELDHMVTMLEKDFKDPYAPKVMPEHQAMADELKPKSGKDYERTFYQDVIKHHQEAVTMIDDYLPKAKSAMLKQMATDMKAAQTKEIAEFKGKVAKLGA